MSFLKQVVVAQDDTNMLSDGRCSLGSSHLTEVLSLFDDSTLSLSSGTVTVFVMLSFLASKHFLPEWWEEVS